MLTLWLEKRLLKNLQAAIFKSALNLLNLEKAALLIGCAVQVIRKIRFSLHLLLKFAFSASVLECNFRASMLEFDFTASVFEKITT